MSLEQIQRCEHCNKSTLSLLLLRPSPIPRAAPLRISGSDAVADAGGHAAGLLPARTPTESRTVLRLLRSGFVHVYIPSPPSPMRQWYVYQINDNADLIPDINPAFDAAKPPAACSRAQHNAFGMRLLTLPQAHRLGTVWIAYSPNVWSDDIRSRNAANPRAMQAVSLSGGSPNTFKPTAQALGQHVLECALHDVKIDGSTALDFPFCALSGEKPVASLARTLQEAAAGHPQTVGKELAVVLRDPTGYARELNHLRVRRHEHATRVTMKGPDAHPLTSIAMLDGLRKSIVDDVAVKAYDAVAPVTSQANFHDVMRIKPNPRGWPQEARWDPLPGSPENLVRYGRGMGRVYFPDHAERAARWQHQQTKATYDRYRTQVHEDWLDDWLLDFEARFKAAHTEPIDRLEADWWGAVHDDLMRDVWGLHFDPHDPNDPRERWSPGAAFTAEVAAVYVPQPYVRGKVLDEYVQHLHRNLADPWAVMGRALMANQFSLWDYITDGRPDKMHDLVSGLVVNGRKAIESGKAGPHREVYSWLLHAAYASGTLAITHAFSGALAAGSVVSSALAGGALAPKALESIERARAWLMASKAITLAQHSVKTNSPLRVPMWVEFHLSTREAVWLRQLSDVPPRDVLRAADQHGRVKIAFAIDHLEVQRLYGGLARAALDAGAGSVRLGDTPAALLLAKGPVVLDVLHGKAVLASSAAQVDRAAATLKEIMSAGRGAFVSLDGHIGLLTAMLNGWGLVKTVSADGWTQDSLARANFLDAVFSMTAGGAAIAEAALAADITHRLGAQAAQKATSVLGARAVAAVFGAAGSGATMVGQFISGRRAQALGDSGAMLGYYTSWGAFLGLTTSQSIIAAGAVAEFIIARGSKWAVWSATAVGTKRVGQWVAQRSLFGLSGWGLVFLGVGLLFEVIAILASPNALQKHLRRSYFGKGDKKDKYKTLRDELAALEVKKTEGEERATPNLSDIAAP